MLKKSLAEFWNLHITKANLRFVIQFKVKFSVGQIRSISYLQIVTNNDLAKSLIYFT